MLLILSDLDVNETSNQDIFIGPEYHKTCGWALLTLANKQPLRKQQHHAGKFCTVKHHFLQKLLTFPSNQSQIHEYFHRDLHNAFWDCFIHFGNIQFYFNLAKSRYLAQILKFWYKKQYAFSGYLNNKKTKIRHPKYVK